MAPPETHAAALVRLAEAEETLRAIGAGEVDAFVVANSDAERQVFTLETADRPYRIFVENMRDGAATVSAAGIILYCNERLSELLARPREEIVGSPLASFISGTLPPGLWKTDSVMAELGLTRRGQDDLPVLIGSSLLDGEDDPLTCVTFTDLSDHKAQGVEIGRLSQAQKDSQASLLHQATHDDLTGLANRALLVERIGRALVNAQRSGRCTAVSFVDLDGFKHVNDSLGHSAGDAVLRDTAERLSQIVRPSDTIARIGGDEFIVLAPDVDSRVHAAEMSERIAAELYRRPEEDKDATHLTASVGVTVAVGGRGTAESLLREADTAMYKAKSLGGGRAEIFDAALGRQVRQRSAAQRMLQSALDEQRVVPYYQPIVDLKTGRFTGFEALARISHQDGSVLPPAAFIPAAEETGLVIPLGKQVLEAACNEAQSWSELSRPRCEFTVAVNIAARQFEPGNLVSVIVDYLKNTGLAARCLHLELTETAVMDLHPGVLEQMVQLHALGVQLGLDDFGTGYASLTHLRRLPLTFVKVDQSFVRNLETIPEDEQIVSAVIDLAANLGLRSIAEGVETVGQLARLRELNCDQAQGYLFARPMPAGDIPEALKQASW